MSVDGLYEGLVWQVSFRVESSNTCNRDVGLDSNFQCEICIQQELGDVEWPIVVMCDSHEVLTASSDTMREYALVCACVCVCVNVASLLAGGEEGKG